MSELLIRVECDCGTFAAIPEAGIFPLCGTCGLRMMLPLDRERVRGWVAEPCNEQQAMRDGRITEVADRNRAYTDEELAAKREACGFPTEPQPWPLRDPGDGYSTPCPPWELQAA